MKQKIILGMGILSMLFGCDKREKLGGDYFYNVKKEVIQYRYSVGGALTWYYRDLHFADSKTFKVFSSVYATDKKNVYFAGLPIKGVSPNGFQIVEEHPSLFAKNTKSKQILYRDSIIDINFQTVKIHSPNYISDNNKVVFIAKRGVSKHGQFHKVPVTDATSFGEFKSKSQSGIAIGYDKHTIYLDGINTKISSNKAQIIKLGLPTIILQNDVLHYIYPSYRDQKITFKDLHSHFKVTSHGKIGTFIYDEFYHFSISGLKEASQILTSNWLTDNNGLYFINRDIIHKVSEKQFEQYTYNNNNPNFLRTNEGLFQIKTYPYEVIHYSSKAEIIKNGIVKDQNKLFLDGEEIKNVDLKTFSKLPKNRGFVDKNFYYYGSLYSKKNIPSWGYKEFLDGKNPDDLFGIEMKYNHTVYKTYWNGFLVSLSMPTKQNETSQVVLEFKNIARKTIELKSPIEGQIYISYQPNDTEPPVYFQHKPTLVLETKYDFKNIKNEENIQFSFPLNQQMVAQLTVEINQHQVTPFLILSDTEFLVERNDYNLHIKANIDN